MIFFHKTVLIDDTIRGLNIFPDGTYVDATLGGGGLSEEILKRLGKKGRLIAIDIDPEAVEYCKTKFEKYENIGIVNSNFANIDSILNGFGICLVDGIAMDLGVSSHQIDCVERGFSYMHDAPLDMRMSKDGVSAYDIVNFMSEEDLCSLIWKFGEEKFSKRIARLICQFRNKKKIHSTLELANIIKNAVPNSGKGNPCKRTFQALRIAVNKELENLETALDKCLKVLNKGGRLAVLSFHSLEDRIVKDKMKFWSKDCVCPEDSPICVCDKKKEVKIITKKVIVPSKDEMSSNSRSKSAKLRICEKI